MDKLPDPIFDERGSMVQCEHSGTGLCESCSELSEMKNACEDDARKDGE